MKRFLSRLFGRRPDVPRDQISSYTDVYEVMRYRAPDRIPPGRLPDIYAFRLLCELYTRLATVGAAGNHHMTLPILQRGFAMILGYCPAHYCRSGLQRRRSSALPKQTLTSSSAAR